MYKHDRGIELGSTEKQLQLSGQSGTGTRALEPPGHAVSFCLSQEKFGGRRVIPTKEK